jgi:hypothetical protein
MWLRHISSDPKGYFWIKNYFATAASQNGFGNFKLSLHEKPNIILKITKKSANFLLLSFFYHREVVKKDHFRTHLLNYANTVL